MIHRRIFCVMFYSWFFLSLIVTGSAGAAEKTTVAVFEIKNRGALVKDDLLLRLKEVLAAGLISRGKYQVVPSKDIQKALLKKKVESYDLRFSQEHQIELGKDVAAKAILSTQLIKMGGQCMISSTLYDLQKSLAERAGLWKGPCTEEGLVNSIHEVTSQLSSQASSANTMKPAGPGEALKTRIWTDHGQNQDGGVYKTAEKLVVFFQANKDCYLQIFYQSADGTNMRIFPNAFSRGSNLVRSGITYVVPSPNDSFEFEVSAPYGQETLTAIASTRPFDSITGKRQDNGLTFVKEPLKEIVARTRGIVVKNKSAEFFEATLQLHTVSSQP